VGAVAALEHVADDAGVRVGAREVERELGMIRGKVRRERRLRHARLEDRVVARLAHLDDAIHP
jgi:hypothetical protein